MVKWEYHVVLSSFQMVDAVRNILNEAGEQGWELVAVSATALFFKRPVPAP